MCERPRFTSKSATAPQVFETANRRLDFSEGRARAMYDRFAAHIEDVRTSLRIDISDSVYNRCIEELRSLREGRFKRVAHSLENLRALVNQLQSLLVLVDDARIDSPPVRLCVDPRVQTPGFDETHISSHPPNR